MKENQDSTAQFLAIFLLVLSLVGYPMVGILVEITGLDHKFLTYPYRAIVLCICALTMILWLRDPRPLPNTYYPLILFLGLYVGRLAFDWIVADHPLVREVSFFFLVVVLAPTAAVLVGLRKQFSDTQIERLLLLIGVPVVGLSLFLILTRSELIERGRATFAALNSISLAQVSGVVFLSAFVALMRPMGVFRRLFLTSVSVAAILVFLYANSRGPIFALILPIAYLIACEWKRSRHIIPALVAVLVWIGLHLDGTSVVQGGSMGVVGRMGQLLEEIPGASTIGSSEQSLSTVGSGDQSLSVIGSGNQSLIGGGDESLSLRWDSISAGVRGFLHNPLLGSYFADPTRPLGLYPHNVLVETAMALGIVGLLVVAVLAIQVMRAAVRLTPSHPLLVALLLQSITLSMISGAIWGSADLTMLTAAILFVFAGRDVSAGTTLLAPK